MAVRLLAIGAIEETTLSSMANNPSWLLPLLPSRATGALLALLYLHPERDYTLAKAGRLIDASPKVMHTEADRLVTTGLVRRSQARPGAAAEGGDRRPGEPSPY